jgi:phage N-6-adenine-methyltransferase
MLDVERAREILKSCRDLDRILEIADAGKLRAEWERLCKNGLGAINDAQRVVVVAHARLGALLLEAKEAGALKRGRKKRSTADDLLLLRDLGLSKDASSLCQKLAKLEARGKLDDHMDVIAARGEKITIKSTIGATSHAHGYDSDEWYTPTDHIEAAREAMGAIDLDPASCPHAQKVVRASKYFTKKDDGLAQEWRGRVWLNPPYSQPAAANFADKLLEELRAARATQAIMVQNSGTDTAWFHKLANAAARLCFVEGRINFLRDDGESAANRYAQTFFYFGNDPGRFAEVFDEFGLVVQRVT